MICQQYMLASFSINNRARENAPPLPGFEPEAV